MTPLKQRIAECLKLTRVLQDDILRHLLQDVLLSLPPEGREQEAPKRPPDYYYDYTEGRMYKTKDAAYRAGCIDRELITLYAFTITTTSNSCAPQEER